MTSVISTAAGTEHSVASTSARHSALVLMIASGFAGLGYQIVWTQQSALWLGHETAAILAVVAAFFGGIALGSFVLSARIDRSTRPARWYAGCEAVIGIWSLALAALMNPSARLLLRAIGDQPSPFHHWLIAFGGTFLLLLPATASMGATLPAMERLLAGLRRDGSPIALLYAANTFGAVLGTLGAAFVLAPMFGFTATAAICACLNLICAVAAFAILPRSSTPVVAPMVTQSREHLRTLAATGFLGIGYEVLVVRVLSQVAENTVYTFALLLAVYLIGTALGAAGYNRWRRSRSADATRDQLLHAQTLTCLLGILALAFADVLKHTVTHFLGNTMSAALAAETTLALAAFLLPTFVMGALFSHLVTAARASGIDFGRALGVNTLGAALAPIVFGVLALPMFGARPALLIVAAGYLALVSSHAWRTTPHWSIAGAIAAMAIWSPTLALVTMPEGARLVSHIEGAGATVSVIEDRNGVRTLHINNRQQEGSNITLIADGRQALLPILLHPHPRKALFLGLGTGITARSAAEDPSLHVDAVELLPEVIDASARFTDAFEANNPRFRVLAADSRRFVRTAREHYDVIVADNFHPARSGSGSLYTIEHFAAVRDRLAPSGLFCQWLPLHQMDLATLRSIVRSFLHEYPNAWAMLATNSLDTPIIGLVAREGNARFDVPAIRSRIDAARIPLRAADFGIPDELALLGSFVAGPAALSRFAADAPLNTDDHPVIMYSAPHITYAPDSLPRDRLITLIDALGLEAHELLASADDGELNRRLAAYWNARNRFLEAGRRIQPTTDVTRMLAQVREPLLEVLRISPEFRPAYDPLLRMAMDLARSDAADARTLLQELARAQPARTEAPQALQALP